MTSSPDPKPDIESRAEIQQLVDAFYARVQQDEVIGFIFTEVAATDWDHHLPKMYDFWETVLFRTGSFQGNPVGVHRALAERTPMGRAQFERWLQLFRETVDALFSGPNAEHIKNCAADIASVLHRKVNHLPDPVRLMMHPQAPVPAFEQQQR